MFRAIFLSTAAVLTLGACATMTHQDARNESAATLANAAAMNGTNAADVVGTTAMAYGDRWTATNLFERAANAHDSVDRRFNLAAGYEATGRLREAADLYQSVVADGQFTTAITTPMKDGHRTRAYRVNVADLASAGLARVTARLAYAPSGVVSATEAGTPVAAIVGAPVGTISDQEAMRRDAIENPVR